MPRAYPPEFRARAIALVRAGKPQKQSAQELDIHPVTLSKWVKQDRIDRGEIPGVRTSESAELRAARLYPVIDRLVDAGVPAYRCCRVLGVAR